MDNHQEHLEPYRHLVREIRSIPPAFKQESSTSNNREDLQPYRHMVRKIQSGRRTEVQPLTWSCSETSSPLTISSTEEILAQKREEIAQKLQAAEQRLKLSEQRTATLEASLIASGVEKQQLELALIQFQGRLEHQAQENQEQTKRLEQLQQLTDQQREAAQAQRLQAENTQLPGPVTIQQCEDHDSTKVPEMLPNQAQDQQLDNQRQLSFNDIASQGSFPMVVLFAALVVVTFAVAKLTVVIWQAFRSLSTAVVRVGNLQSQAIKASQAESRWTGWVEGTAR